jgi:hypothetical protein
LTAPLAVLPPGNNNSLFLNNSNIVGIMLRLYLV